MQHAIDGNAAPHNCRPPRWRRWLPAVLLAATLVPSGQVRAGDAPSAFTPAQRAEIVEILRHALAADPSILREAIGALQADEERQQDAERSADLVRLGPSLVNPADPLAGNPQGNVTVVEFYDLHCPYCRGMAPVLEQLLQTDRKVRLVFKDIPVLGPGSVLGARAVLAAQRQGGYQRLQTAIFHAGGPITEASLQDAAAKAGLDWPRLHRDMADPAIDARLHANLALARRLGVQGTPAFVVGKHMADGATDLDALQQMVAAARQN
jgi:protein-disulfide isomerase